MALPKTKIIKFTNTKATRVGKGVERLRLRQCMSLEDLAIKAELEPSYLSRLENGYEPLVERNVLERIVRAVGVRMRGNELSDEKLLDIFLYAT